MSASGDVAAGGSGPSIRPDGTVLGFDVGARRIGVAVGSAFGSPRAIAVVDVRDGRPDWLRIEGLYKEWRPDGLVVGDPMTLDGGDQPIRKSARAFGEPVPHDCGGMIYERNVAGCGARFADARAGAPAARDAPPVRNRRWIIIERWLPLHGTRSRWQER